MSTNMIMLWMTLAVAAPLPPQEPPVPNEVERAFERVEAATHWRQRNAARDALADLGERALPTVLSGTAHGNADVRGACHEILRDHWATDDRAVDAILRGLDDADGRIAYASAFHLGQHRIARAVPALRAVFDREGVPERVRAVAAKSLGELGAVDLIVTLWHGLGSDDAYTRYLSNLGVKGLCGKDLTEFGYEGPWEGAFVSGPAVAQTKGQAIEKAERRVQRWQAIVAFGKWLREAKPKLFAELEENLW
jgi:hypothetical protein